MYHLQILLYKSLGYVWQFARTCHMHRLENYVQYLANVKMFPLVEEAS